VEPFYRISFHDGRWFEYGRDEAATERLIAEFAPGDVAGYRRMIQDAKAVFEKGFSELSDRPFLKFSDMLRVAPDLIRLQSYKTVYQFAAGYVKDPMLRRVFSFHPLLVGGNPFQTTSIYALIHKKYSDRRLSRMRYSMSLFIIYFGTSRKYDDIKHHTIILGERYKELLNDIFNRKVMGG
jgi:phytoene dehydrogenase-like protein